MNRGDIYWANLDPTVDSEQAGKRPVVIVSRDAINRSSPVVVVVPLTKFTSKKKIYPSQHLINATTSNGLETDSIAKCDQIRAIAVSRLIDRCGSLEAEDLKKLDSALKITLFLK